MTIRIGQPNGQGVAPGRVHGVAIQRAATLCAIIVGGGHNGLVSASYLAKAGLRTLVLEHRELLGGAAVTQEVFPGFRFSVASYVVSLLRPEIIRDLELPRYGLHILPLDGTFTPLDRDHLWRTDNHAQSMRELRRFSTRDAEAYEEYSLLMTQMARFIKPILGITPVDPRRPDPREAVALGGLLRDFSELPRRQQKTFIALMTMSAGGFLERWFETDPLIATMSASWIIGTFLGVRSPGSAYVLLHHYMGEIDGAFRAWGIPRGGTGGGGQRCHRLVGACSGGRDPHERPSGADPHTGRSRQGCRAQGRGGDQRADRTREHGRQGDLP